MHQAKYFNQKVFINIPSLGIDFGNKLGFGQGVEESGFANVGQACDSAFQPHQNPLVHPAIVICGSKYLNLHRLSLSVAESNSGATLTWLLNGSGG